jgi:hypothetical protein
LRHRHPLDLRRNDHIAKFISRIVGDPNLRTSDDFIGEFAGLPGKHKTGRAEDDEKAGHEPSGCQNSMYFHDFETSESSKAYGFGTKSQQNPTTCPKIRAKSTVGGKAADRLPNGT